MTTKKKYPVARFVHRICLLMDMSPERVMRRAGLPCDLLVNEKQGVSPAQTFDIWNALVEESGRSDFALFLGRHLAQAEGNPPIFAFSSSPDVATGFQRAAIFRSMILALKFDISWSGNRLRYFVESADGDVPLPRDRALFEFVYNIELARKYSGFHIIPGRLVIPDFGHDLGILGDYFGLVPSLGTRPYLELKGEDADRPLISRADLLKSDGSAAPHLPAPDTGCPPSIEERVKRALSDLLPAGDCTSEATARAMFMSKRSLHRHLRQYGRSFQSILDETRRGLAEQYLKEDELSVPEISYLLAFKDPNSFYRAFRGWTGQTPGEFRAQP